MNTLKFTSGLILLVTTFTSLALFGSHSTVSANEPYYLKNKIYQVQLSEQEVYKTTQADYVMLGDSITYGVQWNELMGIEGIVNRGIAGDSTEGMLKRLDTVIKLKPKIVFIMAGINDILSNVTTPEETYKNYRTIVEKLEANGIKVVMTSTLFTSTKVKNYKDINARVKKLNYMLSIMAVEKWIPYKDLNAKLAPKGHLEEKFTSDGIHLVGAAYEQWAELLAPELTSNKG